AWFYITLVNSYLYPLFSIYTIG
ncbi:hypothetical protein EHRUM3_06960, partial [Ehrlichia ruminantium]